MFWDAIFLSYSRDDNASYALETRLESIEKALLQVPAWPEFQALLELQARMEAQARIAQAWLESIEKALLEFNPRLEPIEKASIFYSVADGALTTGVLKLIEEQLSEINPVSSVFSHLSRRGI